MSDTIESTLHETRHFAPPEDFVRNARLKPEDLEALHNKADADYEGFWCDLAREKIDWQTEFTQGLDSSNAPHYQWFADGRMNVSYNCIDRHLEARGNKTAILFEAENGQTRALTYRDLYNEVGKLANALKTMGVAKGDRVIIYMPMNAEAVIAMQACARIGAIHSVVFGGFSADALRDRVVDSGAKVVITADGGERGGKVVELKANVDKALDSNPAAVEKVVVCKRAGNDVTMHDGRDVWWDDAVDGESVDCEPEWVEAEHPLFLLYTSGSTGKPKGIQHSSAGYLLGAIVTNEWVFDLQGDDVYWCTADVGWITGHTYVAYGPLAVGATQVVYEGTPTIPDAGRWWQMCQEHGVTVFYTAPTAIRALMKAGPDLPQQYDLSRLRLLGTVGEPINPEAWMWYIHHCWPGALPDRRHLVADRDRRQHDCPDPGRDHPGARFLHPGPAWRRRRCGRRQRQQPGCRPGRLPGHQETMAAHAAHRLGRRPALQGHLLAQVRWQVLPGR